MEYSARLIGIWCCVGLRIRRTFGSPEWKIELWQLGRLGIVAGRAIYQEPQIPYAVNNFGRWFQCSAFLFQLKFKEFMQKRGWG